MLKGTHRVGPPEAWPAVSAPMPAPVRSAARRGMVRALGVAAAVALVPALPVLAGGCRQQVDPAVPPSIVYGEDICAQCGMIISDARFAAAIYVDTEVGPESRIFDDIGDMLAYEYENPDLSVLARYVHDYQTEEWVDAESAVYVRGGDVQSPMGHGLAAFSEAERAAAYAVANGGEVMIFEELSRELTGHDHGPDG